MKSSADLCDVETRALLKALNLAAAHRWQQLGQHTLTNMQSVRLYQTQAQLPDDPIGRGKALGAILKQAVALIEPSRAQDIFQARLNQTPHQVAASDMGLSLDRWYAIQRNEAIPALRAILWELEQAADREQDIELSSKISQRQAVRAAPTPFLAPPLPVHELVGREELLSDLKYQLLEGNKRVIALQGLPGVGKTTLAIALAHDPDIRSRFPDGVLWAGLGCQPDVLAALGLWATTLKVPVQETIQHANLTERAWSVHAAIGLHRMLLVIDDAWKADAALALKVGGPNCSHIVTTRMPSIALDLAGEEHISVRELNTAAGIQLLEQLAPQITCAGHQAVQTLVQAVGGLPLALILMGRHLRKMRGGSQMRRVHQALEQLQTVRTRLQLALPQSPLEQTPGVPSTLGAPLSLQASISLSDTALGPDAQAALHNLALFPPKPNTFSEEAALAVTGLSPGFLDILADHGLLENLGPGRYTLHQTIADYARLRTTNPEAAKRFVNYGTQFSTEHAGESEVLDQERHNLLTALELAFQNRMNDELILGVLALHPFLLERGLYSLAEHHLSRALSVVSPTQDAERYTLFLAHEKSCDVLGKREAQCQDLERLEKLAEALDAPPSPRGGQCRAQVALRRANYAQATSDYGAAIEAARKAVELARAAGDLITQIEGHLQWGQAAWMQANYATACEQSEHALLLTQEARVSAQPQAYTSLLRMEASALRNLGTAAFHQSDYPRAREYYEHSLQLCREIGDRRGEGATLGNLGIVYVVMDDVRHAIVFFEQYRDIAREIGDQRGEGAALGNLGCAYAALSDAHRAIEFFEQHLTIARKISDLCEEGNALGNLGNAYLALGEARHAIEFYEQALSIDHEIGNRRNEGEVLWGKSQALEQLQDHPQAIAQAQAAFEIWKHIEDPRTDVVRKQLDQWQTADS